MRCLRSMAWPLLGFALMLGACASTPLQAEQHEANGGEGADGAEVGERVFFEDFESKPAQSGWRLGSFGNRPMTGGWVQADAAGRKNKKGQFVGPPKGQRAIRLHTGFFQGGGFEVEPLHYYRLIFHSKAQKKGYWAAIFFDEDGEKIGADIYDSVYPSDGWRKHVAMLRAPARAATCQLRLQSRGQPVTFDDVEVTRTDGEAVAAWADRMAAKSPVVRYVPPKDRWQHLDRTIETLKDGGTLRIVMLGDSICNDLSNSLYETILERKYPDAEIKVITSVRGGTGSTYYQKDGNVERHVLQYEPDLLMIGGISHGYDVGAMRSVIRQVRDASDCEVLVMTGVITPRFGSERGHLGRGPLREQLTDLQYFGQRIRKMCAEEEVAFFDIRRAWDRYMVHSIVHDARPHEWYKRDRTHANSRGKQVAGRLLVRWFDPNLDPELFD